MPRLKPVQNENPTGAHGDCEIIENPSKLLEKVGPGVGPNHLAVERANNIVEQMKAAYEARLENEIEELLAAYANMREDGDFDLDRLHDLAHEIRGEAGTYGYQLVSEIGKLLCEYLTPIEKISTTNVLIINEHLKAMQTVVAQQVKGAGPEVGRQIVQGLTTIAEQARASA
jgi:HPt (histidine-containing phosphotransfer) domain-containing protein